MSINAVKFAIASSLSFSIIWIICSLLVWGGPDMMIAIASDMVHMNLSLMGWEMSFGGVLVGLVGWSLSAAAITWLIATIYNKIL